MSLTPWLESSPFEEQRLLQNFFSPAGRSLFWDVNETDGTERTWRLRPRCDVEENANEIMIHAEIPGVKQKDLKVEIQNNQLIINGKVESHREKSEGQKQVNERRYGTFTRAFTFPEKVVNIDKITAEYKDGILQVRIPKRAEEKKVTPKEIQISYKQ